MGFDTVQLERIVKSAESLATSVAMAVGSLIVCASIIVGVYVYGKINRSDRRA
jgi:hypothetical protein